jgi:hypothetical protein
MNPIFPSKSGLIFFRVSMTRFDNHSRFFTLSIGGGVFDVKPVMIILSSFNLFAAVSSSSLVLANKRLSFHLRSAVSTSSLLTLSSIVALVSPVVECSASPPRSTNAALKILSAS